MTKRIFLVFATVFIIASFIIPFASAEEFIVSPDEDAQALYVIMPSRIYNEYDRKIYEVYGFTQQSVAYIANVNPLLQTYFGDLTELSDGVYEYELFSTINNAHRSVFRLTVLNNDTQYKLEYVVSNIGAGVEDKTFIVPVISTDIELMIYADVTGKLYTYFYDRLTLTPQNVPNYSNLELKCNFYGDIYLKGYAPSDITQSDLQDAYNQGKADGEEIGYSDGLRDGQYDLNQQVDSAYERGKDDGYVIGKEEGLAEGASYNNEAAYIAGINKGQEQANIIPEALDGFYNAMLNFFSPFLSIGFGALNLWNMLGIILIIGLAFLAIKITRG